jgi:hypothetical protein
LLRRAIDLRAAIKLGVHITLDDIRADELSAMLLIEDEQAKWEQERAQNGRQQA